MKKLWTVVVETEMVVVAESAEEAEETAEVEIQNYSSTDYAFRASPMRHFPPDWDGDSIPFGDGDDEDPDRDLDAWIAAGAAPEYAATKAKLDAARAATVAQSNEGEAK